MSVRRSGTTSSIGVTPKGIAKIPQLSAAAAELKKKAMASRVSSKLEELKGGREVRKTGQEPAVSTLGPKPAGSTTWATMAGGANDSQPLPPRPVLPAVPPTQPAAMRPPTQPNAMRSVYGQSVQGSQQVFQSAHGSTARRTDMLHHYDEYDEGVIFSTAYHEAHYDQDRIDLNDPNQTASNFGIICSKFRKFIVVARFAKHVTALPIYTYGGRGLSRKKDKDEYVSVRDDDDAPDRAAAAESKHGLLWAYTDHAFKHSKWHRMGNETSVRFTTPYPHQMSSKATISGRLDEDSLERLQNLYKESIFGLPKKSMAPPRPVVPSASLGTGDWNTVSSRAGSRVGQTRPAASGIYNPRR